MEKSALSTLYVEAVRELAKATGNRPSPKYAKQVNALHNEFEPKVLKVVQKFLKTARNKFVQKFKVEDIASKFEAMQKSEEDDIKEEIRKVLEASISVEFIDDLTAELEPLVDELSKEFTSVYQVDLNFNVVNKRAVQYLQEKIDNDFSTLADDQAKGIYAAIADAMASPDKYTIKSIVGAIRDNFLVDTLYFPTSTGVRAVDATTWAMTTARTETARAATYSQRAINESLDLKTWQWLTQDTGCDICDLNDDEIVAMGEAFPSGDTEPPAHANCRCLVIAVVDELLSTQDDNTEDDTSDA